MSELLTLRPEVAAFAQAMERKLRKHDATMGQGWKTDPPLALLDRVDRTADTLYFAIIRKPRDPALVLDEAADVANFAMMIADVCGALKPAPDLEKEPVND